MDETPQTSADDRPLAGSDAASAPTRRGFTLRGRRWVYGATLAAAGVLAGSGVTYAVVGTAETVQTPSVSQDGTSGPGGRGAFGAPPDGAAPDGSAPSTAPDASGSDGTAT